MGDVRERRGEMSRVPEQLPQDQLLPKTPSVSATAGGVWGRGIGATSGCVACPGPPQARSRRGGGPSPAGMSHLNGAPADGALGAGRQLRQPRTAGALPAPPARPRLLPAPGPMGAERIPRGWRVPPPAPPPDGGRPRPA